MLFFFSSLPLSHQAIWKYFKVFLLFFFFFLKRGLYSSPTPFPTPSHQDTPFSCGRPSSGAYYSRIEEIKWMQLRREYNKFIALGGFVCRAFLIHLNIRCCPLFHITLPTMVKKLKGKEIIRHLKSCHSGQQWSWDTEDLYPDSVKWDGLVSSTIKSIFCLKLFKIKQLFPPNLCRIYKLEIT